MVTLSYLHILYITLIFVMLGLMVFRKGTVLPCMAGILIIGWVTTQSAIGGIQALSNALAWSGREFWSVIAAILLVVAISKAPSVLDADALMIHPFNRCMKNRSAAFLLLGLVMFAVSVRIRLFPVAVLVGAVILPPVLETDIPAVRATVAMSLFGHDMAPSGNFFIQGVPTITARAANTTVGTLIREDFVFWAMMAVATATMAFIMFRRNVRNLPSIKTGRPVIPTEKTKPATMATTIATPVAFVLDIVFMLLFKLQGKDTTAFTGDTVLMILATVTRVNGGIMKAFDKIIERLKAGFGFGIDIFTPVIFITGFFFLGGADGARAVLGSNTDIVNDINFYPAQDVSIPRVLVVIVEALAGFVTRLDGSGFSELPIVGTTTATFARALPISGEMLVFLGQIVTIWADGDTLIPWAIIPVAAICGVKSEELMRKSVIPVSSGLAATIIVACFLV